MMSLDLGLKNKIALVTGSTRGIGLFIARALSEQGAQVVINGRDEKSVESVAATMTGAVGIAADVTLVRGQHHLRNAVIDRFGKLDILICNVGRGAYSPPGLETDSEWREAFEINLFSTTGMIDACREDLVKSQGAIVCVSSICGNEVLGAPLAYSAAKSALNAYVSGAARALGPRGVRINGIAPGNIIFPGGSWEKKEKENPSAIQTMLREQVPLMRFGRPEEIAVWACFLCSAVSGFATGAIFTIDGGQTRGW